MTIAAGTVALNIIYEGLWLMILLIMMKKVASSKKHIQFKTRMQKPYPIYDQNGQNKRYPIYDQNGQNKRYPIYDQNG